MTNFRLQLERTYSELPDIFFTKLSPTPVSNPELVIFNEQLANETGLHFSGMTERDKTKFLSGNLIPEGIEPFAQAYAGHQFGNFTMLGDGRAIVLGEHLTPSGQRLDIQLKGSGRTPYSRGGDGRAALGPMLREYIISEAMHALGIPTTRSLAVITTGEKVLRENELPGAILTRIAGSHIRVGTFEFSSLHQDKTITQALLDYLIDRHFPEIKDKENQPLALLEAVIDQQADLITQWMRVGFIHGVMNTDNMALSGETIDYGPCAFIDTYDPKTVFSSIDQTGRYAYCNQPVITKWNLARFAECLIPLINKDQEKAIKIATESINSFEKIYEEKWMNMMRDKLGLFGLDDKDKFLILDLLTWMHERKADYTNTFCHLMNIDLKKVELYSDKDFINWKKRWEDRLLKNNGTLEKSIELMRNNNPLFIPRNHKIEEALEAAEQNDLKPLNKILEVLEKPYDKQEGKEDYQYPSISDEKYKTFCGT